MADYLRIGEVAQAVGVSVDTLRRWEANERAMRLGDPLTHSSLQRIVALGVGIAALIAAVLVAVGTDGG